MLKPFLFALLCTSTFACATGRTTATAPAPAPALASPIVHQEPSPQERQDALREELAAARTRNLARLEVYARAGEFPVNQARPGLLNVFRDSEGHLCAVANLINIDGHSTLINATAVEDNFIVLADVRNGPLLDWILESGFTQEEIGMIQVPYMGEFDQELPIIDEQQLADARAAEVNRVRTALLAVHQALTANSEGSLSIAVQRASYSPSIAGLTPQKFATPPQ